MAKSRGRLPHAFRTAHRTLIARLNVGIRQFKRNMRYSNSQSVCNAIERFVDEFRRVPHWNDELMRRASIVHQQSKSGTAFRQLMGTSFNCYRTRKKKQAGPGISSARPIIQRLKPRLNLRFETELSDFIGTIRRALREGLIPVRCQAKFRLWMKEAGQIAHDARRVEADGCFYLFSVYRDSRASATKLQVAAASILKTNMGGAHLESIKAAAESLFAWARNNPRRMSKRKKTAKSNVSKTPPVMPCYVTLRQMAAIVSKSKPTLERFKKRGGLPNPAVKGGNGKADEWVWSGVQPILENQYRRKLPDVFPSDRFASK